MDEGLCGAPSAVFPGVNCSWPAHRGWGHRHDDGKVVYTWQRRPGSWGAVHTPETTKPVVPME